jgi:hypothetical protein
VVTTVTCSAKDTIQLRLRSRAHARTTLVLLLICTVPAVATCGLNPHNIRLRHLIESGVRSEQLAILHKEADAGDPQLRDIFSREGDPLDIVVINRGGTFLAGEVRLSYPKTSRKLYVLQRGLNESWQLVRTDTASNFPEYRTRDTVDGYREYLTRYPDDPSPDVAAATSRLRELEERESSAASMERFIAAHRKPGSIEAYEDYVRVTSQSDPSWHVASERLDELRFAPYRTKGTPSAYQEFIAKYPTSAKAASLKEQYIFDEKAAASLRATIDALDDLATATGVGLNMAEYGRRLIDAKIKVSKTLDSSTRSALPRTALRAVDSAMSAYENASTVWNWKIQNVRLHSRTYDSGYDYLTIQPDVMAWLQFCPAANIVQGGPGTLGTWLPDIVIQCYWTNARSELAAAKQFVSKS